MPLNDPIKVYFAANNMEANLLCEMLKNAGIEASSVEDHSQMGSWIGGLASNLHKPQVWVNRVDQERARVCIADYERLASERRNATAEDTISLLCEHCGTALVFPVAQSGSVQPCTRCGEFIDVGDDGGWEGWEIDSDAEAGFESDEQSSDNG